MTVSRRAEAVAAAASRRAAPNRRPRGASPSPRLAGTGRARLAALVAGPVAGLWSATAGSTTVEVSSDVAAQGYEVRSPWGDAVLDRRRLGTMLGLYVYDLQGEHLPLEAEYSVRMLMRLDADFGVAGVEARYAPASADRFVPGLEQTELDVLYGYVEGRNLAGGWLGFRVGRQYVTDVLGWWSFDGALVRVTTPLFVQAELYGGLEQRGGLPLSSSRFERPGVWRGDRSTMPEAGLDYPSYLSAELAPALGVALESDGPNTIHGRLSYRRVYNVGQAVTGQFPSPSGQYASADGLRVSQDRLGYALSAFLPEVGAVRGGLVYDFYNQLVSHIEGAVDVYAGSRVTLGADLDHFVPTFDGDSIWNWFTHSPVTTVTARAAVRPLERLELAASGGARLWVADGDPDSFALEQCSRAYGGDAAAIDRCLRLGIDAATSPAALYARSEEARQTSIAPDLLGTLGAAYRWGSGRVSAQGSLEHGLAAASANRGHRGGGSLSARQALDGGQFWLGGTVSVQDWSDPTRRGRDATSFGYVLAPEYAPDDTTRMRVEWEHDMNRLVGQRFRLVGLVQLRVMP